MIDRSFRIGDNRMGIDVYLERGDGPYYVMELPAYRTTSQREFWNTILTGIEFHEFSRLPFQTVFSAIESRVNQLTREEILRAYLGDTCGEIPILKLYRDVYEYKDEQDLFVQFR